jgi:hypothetical protein
MGKSSQFKKFFSTIAVLVVLAIAFLKFCLSEEVELVTV